MLEGPAGSVQVMRMNLWPWDCFLRMNLVVMELLPVGDVRALKVGLEGEIPSAILVLEVDLNEELEAGWYTIVGHVKKIFWGS